MLQKTLKTHIDDMNKAERSKFRKYLVLEMQVAIDAAATQAKSGARPHANTAKTLPHLSDLSIMDHKNRVME